MNYSIVKSRVSWLVVWLLKATYSTLLSDEVLFHHAHSELFNAADRSNTRGQMSYPTY